MQKPKLAAKLPSSGFAALFLAPFFLVQPDCAAAQQPRVPVMTIKIFNSSTDTNIYPVLSTGTSTSSPWLQSAFKVQKSQMANKPYPKLNQFRIYMNPTGDGIPPRSSITLKLPLYSQLVPDSQVNPRLTDQYIDWWGGGRIEIFDSPAADHRPPNALKENYANRPGQVRVKPIAGATIPVCSACQPLVIFKDPAGLKHNEPSQLTEYTLGALNLSKDPIELNEHNVDFDVSYVDDAYLPVVMEPYNNIHVGYIGSPARIDVFRKALNKFVAPTSPFVGWPQYVDNQGDVILKIPSALHVLAGDPDLTPKPWPPIDDLVTNWRQCINGLANPVGCDKMKVVNELFRDNYNNYKKNYANFPSCNKSKQPVPLTPELMISHVYGWGPFNEFCDARTNLLENTPGYADNNGLNYHQIKERFDDLQYLPKGQFDPYALLIHGEDYINAPNVYAYSVDDAVGNMQAEGDGIIISVGGLLGMPNKNPATPPMHVNFGFSVNDKIRFDKYGICTDKPNKNVDPDFSSFDISITDIGNCQLSFVDNRDTFYTFELKSQPPYPAIPRLTDETHAPIDCSGNTNSDARDWCRNIFAYTVKGTKKNEYFVIAPAPQQQ